MAWTRRSRVAGPLLLSAMLLLGLVLHASHSVAQITLDATAPPGAPSLGGPLIFTIPSTAGRLQTPSGAGAGNLFFSFGQFNVPTTGSATFTRIGTPAINNVIARVTGGTQSTIDGVLKLQASPNANAFAAGTNFFLINPFGVVFGPQASTSMTGSFHVSTADYLRFSDDVRFSVKDAAVGEALSAAAPTAFGFLARPVAPISIQGSTAVPAVPTLQVPASAAALTQTLSIVGGDITITGNAEDIPNATATPPIASPAEAWVVGRERLPGTAAAPGGFIGPAQDVAIYTTFIQLPPK